MLGFGGEAAPVSGSVWLLPVARGLGATVRVLDVRDGRVWVEPVAGVGRAWVPVSRLVPVPGREHWEGREGRPGE